MSRPKTAAARRAMAMGGGPFGGRPGLGDRRVGALLLGESAQLPGRQDGVEEVRRPLEREAPVVAVVLREAGAVAAATGRADRAAELLRDDAVDRERPDVAAAVVVVDHEGVQQRQDRGVDPAAVDLRRGLVAGL